MTTTRLARLPNAIVSIFECWRYCRVVCNNSRYVPLQNSFICQSTYQSTCTSVTIQLPHLCASMLSTPIAFLSSLYLNSQIHIHTPRP